MRQVSVAEGALIALSALLADRLCLIAGAGVSMSEPSNLPSAWTLAQRAQQRYTAQLGTPPFPPDIEAQAAYFFGQGQLSTVFLRTLIDKDAFAAPPNPAHTAIADLMLTVGIKTTVTTNVDTMIETAGQLLYGQIESGTSAAAMAVVPPTAAPLLKIHGCRQGDWGNTIWTVKQLDDPATKERLTQCAGWVAHRFAGRDLIVVGFWTDWDYLNAALGGVLGTCAPSRVIVVNPSDEGELRAKAPQLLGLGDRPGVDFIHVPDKADLFLDRLRVAFSQSYIRQVLHHGAAAFTDIKGNPPAPELLEPPELPSDTYYDLRRDLQGCGRRRPATERAPLEVPTLGVTILQLRAAGAQQHGSMWVLNGQVIRVLRAAGRFLHQVQAEHEGDMPPLVAPHVVIAVGADDVPLPSHLVRVADPPNIARGSTSRWVTRQRAVEDLHL